VKPLALGRPLALACLLVSAGTITHAQDVALEHRVKAAYLFNFVRFVEWPAASGEGPLTICVVRPSPFGEVLTDTVRNERVNGRAIATRLVDTADDGCHVVFIPASAAALPSLRAVDESPVLTVGESPGFIRQGGMVNFVREGTNVRFEIDEPAARRAGLRISSRLLRLARVPGA
jgi:hypothetical protein